MGRKVIFIDSALIFSNVSSAQKRSNGSNTSSPLLTKLDCKSFISGLASLDTSKVDILLIADDLNRSEQYRTFFTEEKIKIDIAPFTNRDINFDTLGKYCQEHGIANQDCIVLMNAQSTKRIFASCYPHLGYVDIQQAYKKLFNSELALPIESSAKRDVKSQFNEEPISESNKLKFKESIAFIALNDGYVLNQLNGPTKNFLVLLKELINKNYYLIFCYTEANISDYKNFVSRFNLSLTNSGLNEEGLQFEDLFKDILTINADNPLSQYQVILDDYINNKDLVINGNGFLFYQPALKDYAKAWETYVSKKYPKKTILLMMDPDTLTASLKYLASQPGRAWVEELATIPLTPKTKITPRVPGTPRNKANPQAIDTSTDKGLPNKKGREERALLCLILAELALPLILAGAGILIYYFGLLSLPVLLTSLGAIYGGMVLGGIAGLVLDMLLATIYVSHYIAKAYQVMPIYVEFESTNKPVTKLTNEPAKTSTEAQAALGLTTKPLLNPDQQLVKEQKEKGSSGLKSLLTCFC